MIELKSIAKGRRDENDNIQTSDIAGDSLRDQEQNDCLTTYQPRFLLRQARVESDTSSQDNDVKRRLASGNKRWLSKIGVGRSLSSSTGKTSKGLKSKFARLSSLESTKSSEADSMDAAAIEARQASNTTNASLPLSIQTQLLGYPALSSFDYLRNRPPKSRQDDEEEEEDEDDDDEFGHSFSSSLTHQLHEEERQRAAYAALMDDRQGMNDSEQQFTKGEKAARPSIDESIISESFRLEERHGKFHSAKSSLLHNNSTAGTSGSGFGRAGSASGNQLNTSIKSSRRSKSPSSLYGSRRSKSSGHRRGLFGLASRLKLTRRHESIEGFQLTVLNSGFISLKRLDKDLASFLPKERMSPMEFDARVKLMRKYPVLAKIEYKFASRYETYVCRHALVDANQEKNNQKRCIPYDYNRVVLKSLPDKPNSDYINASHVDSFIKPNAYIAAQGPNENTTADFWRMVWEQKSCVIVMLTKVFDFIRVMCNQYWPVEVGKSELYGNLEVTLLYEEPLADFVIRTIKLTKLKTVKNKSSASGDKADPVEAMDSGNKDKEFGDEELDDEVSLDQELVGSTEEVSQADDSGLNVGARVRSPKFVLTKSSRARRSPLGQTDSLASPQQQQQRKSLLQRRVAENERHSTSGVGLHLNHSQLMRPHSAAAGSLKPESPTTLSRNRNSRAAGGSPSDLLRPPSFVLGNQRNQFGGSLSSLVSMPQTPTSPLTPSTASGIDRLSSTRKAVKKKRRVREKNTRPIRTQFQVPDESQLMDDDDEDDEEGDCELDADVEIQLEDEQQEDSKSQTLPGGTQASGSGRQTRASNQTVASERIIYQFHYNGWASHTCPFISSLLHFRRRVRICMDEMAKSGRTGPTIVHCNDGCGRTGTYLCIDANLELVDEDNVYDVFQYTKKLRQSRKFLIESLEQYKFVYDTIEEAQFCGRTWFPISELHKRLKHKSQRNLLSKKNEYQIEYEKICSMTSKFSIGDCAGGHRVENREKNRDVSTVPPDNFRPYLSSFQTNDSTDYINAVFVDGYTRSKEYIVTEWPLYKTISDFWSLVYDHDCNSVILLANPPESTTYPSFLPSEKELRRKFGPVFSAEMVSYTHYQNIKSWIYTINKKIVSLTEVIAGVKSEAKTTQVFQITCWPQGHRVPTSTNALVELMNMVERWRQRTAYGPVCVVSLNGKSRAGVYCAANVAIEQVVQHGEVDVFQAVKTVRRHRPQLIENMTEYKYCYDLILHYVLYYLNQPNSAT